MAGPERVGGDEESTSLVWAERCEGGVDLAFTAGLHDNEFLPDGTCGFRHVFQLDLAFGKIRVHKKGNRVGFAHDVAQQPQPLRPEFPVKQAHPGHIATRPIEAGDKAGRDRIGATREHDRDRSRGCLGGYRCGWSACRRNHCHLTAYKVAR
jgi:hypothetical protein